MGLVSMLALGACAGETEAPEQTRTADRTVALAELQSRVGSEVKMELGERGATRVLAMDRRFPVRSVDVDPAVAATRFLADHRALFQLDENDVADFAVTRVDDEPVGGVRHVTLQRTVDGDAVFQGAITVHMNAQNDIFTALGDDNYRVTRPTNRKMVTPDLAARATLRAFDLDDGSLALASSESDHTVFKSSRLIDDLHVVPKVYQLAANDSRFVHQVTVAWNDEDRQLQMQLVLVDAQSGELLQNFNLVNDFTGRAFTASPGAAPVTDGRVLVSFDGNPAASPLGWVGATKKTIGNNAVAATDLNANNVVGTDETEPVANASNSFDFPFSAAQDAANFKAAAVANAFYLVNDYHDRLYLLGFTETSGNFQTTNFGKGGAQNDEVQVDAQDGSSTNNANFATPPDGQHPRMQLFLFNRAHGATLRQDGDFDPSIIYHESTHGVSNRLVGGGSTACLNNLQSGGMGEGWGDFMGASFLNNPVIGAYVTGNATTGIRRASMASSPFTYTDIKNGNLAEIHDVGELWAATLWDVRKALGAATTERLVVAGMKLTPCNPTMLNARDGIIQADANLNGGANRCTIWTAFAGRQMGFGAASPNDQSTAAVIPSTAVPVDCPGGVATGTTRNFTSTTVPRAIPDYNATGVRSTIAVTTAGLDVQRVQANVNISHTFRGDLVIQVIAPNGQVSTLSNRAGGSADNYVAANLDITSAFTRGSAATGTWQLFVRDLASGDVGTINSFSLSITSTH